MQLYSLYKYLQFEWPNICLFRPLSETVLLKSVIFKHIALLYLWIQSFINELWKHVFLSATVSCDSENEGNNATVYFYDGPEEWVILLADTYNQETNEILWQSNFIFQSFSGRRCVYKSVTSICVVQIYNQNLKGVQSQRWFCRHTLMPGILCYW